MTTVEAELRTVRDLCEAQASGGALSQRARGRTRAREGLTQV